MQFSIEGPGKIVVVDNGNPVSHEFFVADYRTAFKGLALVIVRSTETPGEIKLIAESETLKADHVFIETTNSSSLRILYQLFWILK